MFAKSKSVARIAVALAALVTIFVALEQAQTRAKRVTPLDTTQKQSFERQAKVAVLAGVGKYASRSGLTSLQFPAHDVDLIQAELEKQGYKVVALKDAEATRGAIEQSLTDAKDLVDQNSGTILFFFSGHGFADGGQNYLATYESAAANLAGSGLPVKRVEELMKATGAQRQMMFLDACRNEAGKSAIGARSFDRLDAAAGLHALLSTKAGKISYEDDSLGSGVFTHFLVEGLRGQAAGSDGLITFHDLATYVVDGVSGYGFQHGQMQVPYEAGEFSGDFLIAEATPTAGAVARPPSPPAKPNLERVGGAHAPTVSHINAFLPAKIVECEGPNCTPNENAGPRNSPVWSFDGMKGTGHFGTGLQPLVVEHYDGTTIVVRRNDTSGPVIGLTARYIGIIEGNRITGSITYWPGANTSPWTADLELSQNPIPSELTAQSSVPFPFRVVECEAANCMPNESAGPRNSPIWTFSNTQGLGQFGTGNQPLTLIHADNEVIAVRREDTSGPAMGLIAVYLGMIQGNRIQGSVTYWHGNGPRTGMWSGVLEKQ